MYFLVLLYALFFCGWSLPQGICFFKAVPFYLRDKKTTFCTFKFIYKSIYTSLKNTGFLYFFWCALHSNVVYGYLPCTVKPQTQKEIQLINGLWENVFHTQKYCLKGKKKRYGLKNLNFDRFIFTYVRPTVTTSVILVKKIQIYTFLEAGNSQESIGHLNFYFWHLQHC